MKVKTTGGASVEVVSGRTRDSFWFSDFYFFDLPSSHDARARLVAEQQLERCRCGARGAMADFVDVPAWGDEKGVFMRAKDVEKVVKAQQVCACVSLLCRCCDQVPG